MKGLGIVIIFLCLKSLVLRSMEQVPSSLASQAAAVVAAHPALWPQVFQINSDVQAMVAQKVVNVIIKPALLPLVLKKPQSSPSLHQHGVCGLETISRAGKIISIACDGKIALCQESVPNQCRVIDTQKSWYCACLKCEPPLICLGGLGGEIGYMNIDAMQPHHIFKAHTQAVNALSLSPTQDQLISCSNDGDIKLWDVNSANERVTFKGHKRAVKNAFSMIAHQKIISGAADHTLRLWDIETAKEEQRYTIDDDINIFRLARHPHEQIGVVGLNNGVVGLCDIRRNRNIDGLIGHTTVVAALMCSDEGNYIASASWDREVRVWDLRMRACSAILSFHKDWVQSISSLRNFQKIISGSRDGTVKLWDLKAILALDRIDDFKKVAEHASVVKSDHALSHQARIELLKKITGAEPEQLDEAHQ